MEYHSAIKNKDIMNFAGKQMELENIILSEVTQTKKDMHSMYSLISGYQSYITGWPLYIPQIKRSPQESMWMTLAEMNSSGDMEPEGPTSCSQAGPPVRDKDTNPPIKTFDPKFVLSKRNAGTKMKQTEEMAHQ